MKPERLKISYRALFSALKRTRVATWLTAPRDLELQKIHGLTVKPGIKAKYRDGENLIIYSLFDVEKRTPFEFTLDVTLQQCEYDLSKIETGISDMPEKFLREEPFLEHMPWVVDVVQRLINNKKTTLERVHALFDFVINSFEYKYPVSQRGVALMKPRQLVGDCGEYSSLFVTMCRIAGIPAQNETGFVLNPKTRTIIEHGWASIYLKPYGWMDVDTQWGQIEKREGRDAMTYFLRRADYRIIFSHGLNIRLSPSVPTKWTFDYWKKEGLPMTNNSVQILQPLVFATRDPVEFEATISFE